MNDTHGGPIHLLLTDMVLPHAGGVQIAERVTASRKEIKVLYMSGYADPRVTEHPVLTAGGAFLQKPITPQSLLKKVYEVLHRTA